MTPLVTFNVAGCVTTGHEGDVRAAETLILMRLKPTQATLHTRALETLSLRRKEYARAAIRAYLWQVRRGDIRFARPVFPTFFPFL